MATLKVYKEENLIEKLYLGTVEKTVQESAYYGASFEKPFNTDDLYKKKGDLSLYEEMLKDDQVFIGSQIKKDIMLGPGWDIVVESEEDKDKDFFNDVRDDLYKSLTEDVEIPFDSSLEEILTSQDFGFSLSEKVFKRRKDSSLTLKFIKTRHPDTWLIETDYQGNIQKYLQRGTKNDIEIDPGSLIHMVNNRKFQNPYGTSDLRPAYNAWFTKRQIIRYYGIFLEKAASPTPVAKYDLNAPQEAITAIHNAIQKFQAKTALTIPKDIDIEFLESKSNGEAYIKGINIMNMMIGRALLIPDLVGISGSETEGGSHSLGQEHLNLYYRHLERRRKSLEDMINKHIIRPLVIANYGLLDIMPEFRFRPIKEENVTENMKLWLDSARLKLYEPTDEEINYFRSQINFPISEIERPEPMGISGPNVTGNPSGTNGVNSTNDANDDLKKEKKSFKRIFEPSEVQKRVNFKALEKELDSNLENLINTIRPVAKKSIERLIETIESKKIIQNGNFEKLDSLKMSGLAEMKTIIKNHLKSGFKNAKAQAQSELFSKKFGEPLPSDEFLNFLNQETFDYIGDWDYSMMKWSKIKLRQAIKDGTPMAEVLYDLEQELDNKSQVSIDRYARTKFTEVMNKGRVEFFNESKIVEGYEYSAVMDGQTTYICHGLHGKMFVKGKEPIPPMHFNALHNDSIIITRNGSKLISDILIGDKVLTHNGNWREVYDVMNKYQDKEYLEIELENGEKIKATGEHPVFVLRNGSPAWVRADQLNRFDDIICLKDICGVFNVA